MAQPAIDPTALAAAKDGDTPATSALITALRRQVESEARAREQQQAKQLALPGPPGQQQQKKKEEPEEESSSSEDEELPPDPQNCTVSGPGFTVRSFGLAKGEPGAGSRQGCRVTHEDSHPPLHVAPPARNVLHW
eukprot:360150-Pelagomonas_calceolata.AAC.3